MALGADELTEIERMVETVAALEPTFACSRSAASCAEAPPPNITACPRSAYRLPSAEPRLPAPMIPSLNARRFRG